MPFLRHIYVSSRSEPEWSPDLMHQDVYIIEFLRKPRVQLLNALSRKKVPLLLVNSFEIIPSSCVDFQAIPFFGVKWNLNDQTCL